MRTIIAGSRELTDYSLVVEAANTFETLFNCKISVVISGGARGIDTLGERYAKEHNIPIERYVPDWSTGKGAGFVRNQQMADVAEACIAITTGTNGTADMISRATKKELKLCVKKVAKPVSYIDSTKEFLE